MNGHSCPAIHPTFCLKAFQWLLVAAAIFVLGGRIVRWDAKPASHDDNFDKRLKAMVNESNQHGSRQLDGMTRLDYTELGPGRRVTYHCTVFHSLGPNSDSEWFANLLRDRALADWKTRDEFQSFREHNVELCFKYKDMQGKSLLATVIKAADL